MRRPAAAAVAIGLVLIAAAAVVRVAVAPALAKLPASTNTTRFYQGTAAVLFDPAALAPGSTAPLLLRNVPLQITHTVRALRSTGSATVVRDTKLVTAAGQPVASLDSSYAVSRTSLLPTTSLGSPGLAHPLGLTFNWPIGTARHNYPGWVVDTGTATTLVYTGTARHGGIQTDVFTATVPPTPITNPQELAGLPASVPKAEASGLITKLDLPAAQIAQFAQVAGSLPATIPLAYTYAAQTTFWVAPDSGIVVDLNSTETRAVGLPSSLLGIAIPLATISQFQFSDTPATLAAAAAQANRDRAGLTAIRTTVPGALGAVGLVLLLAAAALGRRRRPHVIDLTAMDPPPGIDLTTVERPSAAVASRGHAGASAVTGPAATGGGIPTPRDATADEPAPADG
ncbi:MAG TPA: porin PorA family protein [Mycobacteriales bacterium]|nr:porin PorA family protein [Mycobacteriales bacterium]